MPQLTRRKLLATAPVAAAAGAVVLKGASSTRADEHTHTAPVTDPGAVRHDAMGHAAGGHAHFRGSVDHQANGFSPHEILRDFDEGKVSKLEDGRTLREFDLTAYDKEIEIAPGVKYAAWTYNGRVPGPTLRATEGEVVRVKLLNGSEHPHTIHFHGLHAARVDGVAGQGPGDVPPGETAVYEFVAEPFGLHLYHCHVRPLAEHIGKGLYGAFIIDPKDGRPEADEMVMVMNGFDTNFDKANEVYAANTIGFAYMDQPVQVEKDKLVRIYLVNVLEFDLLNSFHVHGNFFNWYPTGTSKQSSEFTDTVMLCQGQRGILELEFPYYGRYMFHAHQSEFTELGWQGFFEVCDRKSDGSLICPLPPDGEKG